MPSNASERSSIAVSNSFQRCSGRLAARVYLGPEQFDSGNAPFVRRDLIERYAKRRRREVVLVVRGERQPDYELVRKHPQWYVNAARSHADEWQFARCLNDLL